jgi:hypothetical protein
MIIVDASIPARGYNYYILKNEHYFPITHLIPKLRPPKLD